MKRFLCITALLLAVSCARQTIIPDDELAQIIHDAFVANAYLQQRGEQADSANIYEPIFARYGYTTEDVQNTIGNFSRRKSARLSDVVERAIHQLETESAYYTGEVAILDTINAVALRRARSRVYADSLIRVERLADTARFEVTLDDLRPGTYTVRFDYLIDSLDANRGQRFQMRVERRNGRMQPPATTYLTRLREMSLQREVTVDSTARRLHVTLYGLHTNTPKRPSVTVRNLRIDHTPPLGEALDRLYREQLNLEIFADDFCNPFAPDRGALPADSLGLR